MKASVCLPLVVLTVLAHPAVSQDTHTPQELQTLIEDQAATILTLQAKVDSQWALLGDLQTRLKAQEALMETSVNRTGALEEANEAVAFYVDFGKQPYHEVNVSHNTPVLFNRVVLNVGGGYDESTGIFTASKRGIYTFNLHMMSTESDGYIQLGIYSEGSEEIVTFAKGEHGTNDQGSATAVMQLDKGQQVHVRHDFGELHMWGSRLTSFSGSLIQALE